MSSPIVIDSSHLASFKKFESFAFSFPNLSEEEERNLMELKEQGDQEAAKKLIFSFLKLVLSIARTQKGYEIDEEDLIQEGVIGLMVAVKKFNPSKQVRFATYAHQYILGNIRAYVENNFGVVKLVTTKDLKKAFYDRGNKRNNVDAKTREEGKIRFSAGTFVDIDGSTEDDGDFLQLPDRRYEPQCLLMRHENDVIINSIIPQVVSAVLNDREQEIIRARYLVDDDVERTTLFDLGEKFSVSTERIRQIEKGALTKIKNELKNGYGIDQHHFN